MCTGGSKLSHRSFSCSKTNSLIFSERYTPAPSTHTTRRVGPPRRCDGGLETRSARYERGEHHAGTF